MRAKRSTDMNLVQLFSFLCREFERVFFNAHKSGGQKVKCGEKKSFCRGAFAEVHSVPEQLRVVPRSVLLHENISDVQNHTDSSRTLKAFS